MEIRPRQKMEQTPVMDVATLRQHFVCDSLFRDDEIHFVYSEYDAMIIGGAKPVNRKILLTSDPAMQTEYFLELREIGIINVGGAGIVSADGVLYDMEYLSCTYLGKGSTDVSFSSHDPASPALFYMVSTPCGHAFPNRHFTQEEVTPIDLTLAAYTDFPFEYKYIYKDGILSCKLLMGVTVVKNGNVLNEALEDAYKDCSRVYFYFDIKDGSSVLHSFGEAAATKDIMLANYEAVIAPSWNTAACCHPGNYAFVWAIAAENQPVTDTKRYVV